MVPEGELVNYLHLMNYDYNYNAIPDFGMDWVQIITRGKKNTFFFGTEKKRLKDTNYLNHSSYLSKILVTSFSQS